MKRKFLLHEDLKSLNHIINSRLKLLTTDLHIEEDTFFENLTNYSSDPYAEILKRTGLVAEERIVLILALAPYIKPEILDRLFLNNEITNANYTQLGGKISQNTSSFLPTGETAIFLCGGINLSSKLSLQYIFDASQPLYRHNLVKLQAVDQGDPPLSGRIIPTEECLHYIISGQEFKPTYNSNFPAHLLNTPLSWQDLVLPYDTLKSLDELDAWLGHHRELAKITKLSKKFKRGYRALFHGPSGTGKTLTASLLGKKYNKEVYHIDLSMMVSKYIGETEKNLRNVFDTAETKEWILFFDEADALFGKRTNVQSSNDRYANQEISYLLQRIEDYPGLIVLASNLKTNMDKAFLRRFQSVVYFPVPGVEERFLLWVKAFDDELTLEKSIDLKQIAKDFEITGATIGNVLRYCSLMALRRKSMKVLEEELVEGIARELAKEGKMI